MSLYDQLSQRLEFIPHLSLNTSFSVQRLNEDYQKIKDTVQPYQTSLSQAKDLIARSWHGVSIYGLWGHPYDDLTEDYVRNSDMQYYLTQVGEKVPYIVECIKALGGEGKRCRLMTVKPQGRLVWHSHKHDSNVSYNPYEIVVHIPIVSPLGFRYSVVNVEKYRTVDFETEPLPIHTASYPVGQAWYFNSAHMHNVFNPSNQDRVSIMMYLDIRNPLTMAAISQPTFEYKGPFL